MDKEDTFGSLFVRTNYQEVDMQEAEAPTTYATHIPKNELCLFLASKCPNPIKYVRCGHEKGKNTDLACYNTSIHMSS